MLGLEAVIAFQRFYGDAEVTKQPAIHQKVLHIGEVIKHLKQHVNEEEVVLFMLDTMNLA
jgi:hypothetical protein